MVYGIKDMLKPMKKNNRSMKGFTVDMMKKGARTGERMAGKR